MPEINAKSAIMRATRLVAARISGNEQLVKEITNDGDAFELECGLVGITCAAVLTLAAELKVPVSELLDLMIMQTEELV